jgi:hypothetical protein
MKIFLDDFIVFNSLSTHLKKFKKCFLKCREYSISLNQEKYAFMVYFETIFGFIISKGRKRHVPKKIEVIVKMLILKTS